ncbi:MAG: hypothetical protein HYR85_20075 [Planctomycetes bacterium]|nr:hypothetical protein [Planctomycetota bacterium]
MTRTPDRLRRNSGLALIAVLTVLFALVLIATPFAVSMRDQLTESYTFSQKARAQMALDAAFAHARAALVRGCASLDPTPDVDTQDEMKIDFTSLADWFGDPRGVVATVRVEDEQGKINLNSATLGVLGNLIGCARLTHEIDSGAAEIPVDDASRFPVSGGAVVIDGELIAYSRVAGAGLTGCRRGERAQQGFLAARQHAQGAVVIDARAEEVQRWRIAARSGEYSQYPTPSAIRSIADLCVASISADALEAILPLVTVDSTRLGAPGWANPQGFIDPRLDPALLQLVTTDGAPINLQSTRFLAPGTLLRLRDGKTTLYRMVGDLQSREEGEMKPFGLQVNSKNLPDIQKQLRERLTQQGNVSGEALDRRVAELTDFFSTASLQGSVVGVLVGEPMPSDLDTNFTITESETPHPVNVNTASDAVLMALLVNLQLRRHDDTVTTDEAKAVIARMRKAPVTSWQYLLEEVLQKSREANEISDDDLQAIYLNGQNPADIRLAFATMPFCFKSGDVYTLDGAASVSSAAGVEQSRATLREIVSVAPQRPLEWTLTTQQQFEDQIVPGEIGRWVETYPTHVDRWEGRTMPPSRYPQNKFERLFATVEAEDEKGEDQGDVRLMPARREKNDSNIEHFDRSAYNDGYKLDKGGYRWNAVSRLRTQEGYLGSGTFRFWLRTIGGGGDRTLYDAGEQNGRNRVTLTYDGTNSRFVFRVSDTALDDASNQVPDAMEVTYAAPLREDTCYHVLAGFRGTKPGDLVLMVDGDASREKPRYLTRLTTQIDATSTPGRIDVEDADGFPPSGALLIGREIFEYTSRSKTSFTLRSNTTANNVPIGRGWRGSGIGTGGANVQEEHPAQAAVELYGYSNATSSDVPIGGATLTGSRSLGTFNVGAIASTHPIHLTGGGTGPPGLDPNDVTIPLAVPPGGSNRFMDAFQDKGYALILDAGQTYQVYQNGRPVGPPIAAGGGELIYYGGVSGTTLTNVARGQTSPNNAAPDVPSPIGITKATWHLNKNNGALQPNVVIPLSVWARGGNLREGYLDPMRKGNLSLEERAQVDDEWFRYDAIDRGDEFFLRDNLKPVMAVLEAIIGNSTPIRIDIGGGPRPFAPPPPQAAFPLAHLRTELQFRSVDQTEDTSHSTGTEVIPCFRVGGIGVGRDDVVTLLAPGGRQKEQHTVNWASWFKMQSRGPFNFVAFKENVQHRYVSTIEARMFADLPALNGPGRVFTETTDRRGMTRIVKFPSGELPSTTPDIAMVGAGIDGAGLTPGFLDELEGGSFREGRNQQVARPYLVYHAPSAPANSYVKSGDQEVTLYRADGYHDHSGRLHTWYRAIVNQPWEYTPLPDDAGIVRIDQEWIAYRGLENGSETGSNGQRYDWVKMTGCQRGLFGTTASNHALDAKAMLIGFLPIAKLTSGVGPESASIPVVNTRGFYGSGLLGFFDENGRIGEMAHFDRHSPNSFDMPMKRASDGTSEGAGIFRGRFGTAAQAHANDALVIDMPHRYWDRYQKEVDRPELGYFAATAEISGAYFQAIEWDEKQPKPFLDVKVLVRIDERAPWDAQPEGEKNGLFLFDDPPSEKNVNRIGMRGDRIEVRVFFEYLPGAFNSQFTSDSWKETPWLKALRVKYLAPNVVRRTEETP